jgi:hypothetical protein
VTRQWLEAKGVPKERLHRLLQDHHVVGEAHDSELIVTLCLNCHGEITEGLRVEGVSMNPEENLIKLIALMLRGSAVLFDSLANSYRKWATLLEKRSEDLETLKPMTRGTANDRTKTA